ncbi:MAG: hypothetical protein R3248_13875 [Candidatus Promineifilaceae bacterium]|nr:hypothetical protein [Candidatus Promineifilaceae bacterium]
MGLSLDEHFGTQVKLGIFFHPDRREGFVEAFGPERGYPPLPAYA